MLFINCSLRLFRPLGVSVFFFLNEILFFALRRVIFLVGNNSSSISGSLKWEGTAGDEFT